MRRSVRACHRLRFGDNACVMRTTPQIGPFTFRENVVMLNSTWSEDGDLIK